MKTKNLQKLQNFQFFCKCLTQIFVLVQTGPKLKIFPKSLISEKKNHYCIQSNHDNKTTFSVTSSLSRGTQRSSVSYAMLMRPNKAKAAVHSCWLLSSSAFLGSSTVSSLFVPLT